MGTVHQSRGMLLSRQRHHIRPCDVLALILAFCSHVAVVRAIVDKEAVKPLVKKTIEVMTACSGEAADAPVSRDVLLKCTATEQAKTTHVFPKEIFEVLHDENLISRVTRQTRKKFWNYLNPEKVGEEVMAVAEAERKELDKAKAETFDVKKRTAELLKDFLADQQAKAEEVIYVILDKIPSEIITPAGLKAPKLEMQRLLNAGYLRLFGRSAEAFRKYVKHLCQKHHTPQVKELGDGNNNQGIAYLVTDTDAEAPAKEAVLKVVTRPPNKKQEEFEIQKFLDGKDWQSIKDYDENGDEKIIAAKDKFIPHVLMVDKSKDKEQVFDFIVMERLGITVNEWMELPKEDKRRPTNNELMQVLSRTYSILKAMHSGYRHGDNHYNNWALSRTNQKVLYLFDFGRTKQMSDFTWIATDWFRWVELLEDFAPMISDDREKISTRMKRVLVKGVMKLIPCVTGCVETPAQLKTRMNNVRSKLMTELRKILWFNPDMEGKNAPYQELFAPTYKSTIAMEGFKQFRQIAEEFLATADSPVDVSTTLYHWKPKKGERRKREVEHPRSLLVVEVDAMPGRQTE